MNIDLDGDLNHSSESSSITLSAMWSSVTVKKFGLVFAFCTSLLSFSVQAQTVIAGNALPINGNVVAGTAAISTSGNVLNVNQSSNKAVINWESFNVGSQATVNFNQPNANAVTLNRVTGFQESQINGAINANGTVVLVNSAGIVFGKGAQVNTGALVASTLDIGDSNFMNGSYDFKGANNSVAKIINQGTLNANSANGYIALLAPEVRNEGYLIATKSAGNTIAMASGSDITLHISGSGLTGLRVNAAAYNGLVENAHVVETAGGLVILAASAANQLMGSVIKNTGSISANSIINNGGQVFLQAGSINNAGIISANGEQKGGVISLLAQGIELMLGSKIEARTNMGTGGTVNVGVNNIKLTPAQSYVSAQSDSLASTVVLNPDSIIDVSAITTGNAGSINILSSAKTVIAGVLNALGGMNAGNGGSVLTGSQGVLQVLRNTIVNVGAGIGNIGTWTLANPAGLTINSDAAKVISDALSKGNVILTANSAICAEFGGCQNSNFGGINLQGDIEKSGVISSTLSISTNGAFLSQANISNIESGTLKLFVRAESVTITSTSNIVANKVDIAVVQAIDIFGNVLVNGQSPLINLAGATINILGSIGTRRDPFATNSSHAIDDAATILINASNLIAVASGGAVVANGYVGGVIELQAPKVTIAGYLSAEGLVGDGGLIQIKSDVIDIISAHLLANGANAGGSIQIADMSAGMLSLSNSFVQTNGGSGPGGTISFKTLGDISLMNTSLMSNGSTSGGFIKLVSNADSVVLQNSVVQTNGSNGRGGTIAISGKNNTALINSVIAANGSAAGGSIYLGYASAKSDLIPFSEHLNIDAQASHGTGGLVIPPQAN